MTSNTNLSADIALPSFSKCPQETSDSGTLPKAEGVKDKSNFGIGT